MPVVATDVWTPFLGMKGGGKVLVNIVLTECGIQIMQLDGLD